MNALLEAGSTANLNQLMEERRGYGLQLAESSKWRDVCKGLEEGSWRRATAAILLENLDQAISGLTETVRTTLIGDFEKYAFPLVRAIFPELIANQLVSVQPMNGPVSLVFYMDYVYGTSKGAVTRGSRMFDSIGLGSSNPNYSSETVENEVLDTTDRAINAAFTPTFAFVPIRPGTVIITDGTLRITDDGNGNLVGDIGSGGTNTIDYNSGVSSFSFGTDPAAPVSATYEYDMENNSALPEVDLVLVQSPVIAKPRKLKTNWSLESGFNLRTLHGLEIETELTSAVGSEIRFEIDREVVDRISKIAAAGSDFDAGSVGAESYSERKLAFVDTIVSHGNKIFAQTGRASASWIMVGINVANIIEALPGFVRIPVGAMVKGPHKAGRLNGNWDVFKDPFGFGTGATPYNNFMCGYKGTEFLEAGLVYAPYIPLYTTPTVVLDDFKARKGLATQYGMKVVNPKFYTSGKVTTPQVTSF